MNTAKRTDPAAWAAAMAETNPILRWAGDSFGRYVDTVSDLLAASEAALKPVEKVEQLKLARLALEDLVALMRDVPGFELTGLDAFRQRISRLEQTYRAFGYYRMTGLWPSAVIGDGLTKRDRQEFQLVIDQRDCPTLSQFGLPDQL